MTAAEARRRIQELARGGNVTFLPHAQQRMKERDISRSGVLRVLRYGARCEAYDVDGWRVFGKDEEGQDLAVGVFIEEGVLVATVMWF